MLQVFKLQFETIALKERKSLVASITSDIYLPIYLGVHLNYKVN